jgi:hypothetical protein
VAVLFVNKILFFSDLFLYYFLVAGDDDVSRKTDDALSGALTSAAISN